MQKLLTLTQDRSKLVQIFAVLGFALLPAFASQIALRFPFTPVPLFLTCNIVWASGLFLGPRRAFMAMALFVLQGLAGLPVFSSGQSGLGTLLGPVGGYIVSFPFAAYLVGWIYERTNRSSWKAYLSMSAGMVFTYAMGCAWLTQFVGAKSVLICGLAPFILKELVINGLLSVRNPLR